MADHHADLARPAERHQDQGPDRGFKAVWNAKIEALIERHVEHHVRDIHARKRARAKGWKALWISLCIRRVRAARAARASRIAPVMRRCNIAQGVDFTKLS